MLPMLMMTPPPWRMWRRAVRQPWTTPQKFTSNSRRLSSSGTSSSFPKMETPALFTQVLIEPNSRNAAVAMASTSSGFATSATTKVARPPADVISVVTRLRSASFRELRTTFAPCRAASRAVERPIPLEAPVMTMVCSLSFLSLLRCPGMNKRCATTLPQARIRRIRGGSMRHRIAALLIATALGVTAVHAQSGATQTSGYLTPPKAVVDIMTAEQLPTVTVGPNRGLMILMARSSMPSIAEVSQPMLRIGGLRINPRTNGPHRMGGGTALTLRNISTGAERKIPVPANAQLGDVSFSPDGKWVSFSNTRETGIDLYVADVATAAPKKVTGAALNGLSSGCEWLDDSSALLCALVPAGRGSPPEEPKVPKGPNIQESIGKAGPVRTYQDLLSSAYDEALFEYYMQSQLAFIDAATLRVRPSGKPGLITAASASPDGQYLLVERTKRPFSRLLPYSRFPQDVEIWTRAGERVRAIADVPMGDTIPMNGVINAPRSHQWVPVEPATLVWVEALDKGDLDNDVPHRDRFLSFAAPF